MRQTVQRVDLDLDSLKGSMDSEHDRGYLKWGSDEILRDWYSILCQTFAKGSLSERGGVRAYREHPVISQTCYIGERSGEKGRHEKNCLAEHVSCCMLCTIGCYLSDKRHWILFEARRMLPAKTYQPRIVESSYSAQNTNHR
ncbi:hypothetical protein TNCV_1310761 [Trichonephila clavipes]|nr:hypothetical protein TNCV_1310761 [Trichonephila clavipes]